MTFKNAAFFGIFLNNKLAISIIFETSKCSYWTKGKSKANFGPLLDCCNPKSKLDCNELVFLKKINRFILFKEENNSNQISLRDPIGFINSCKL